jgi:hypothetical protein
MRYSCSLRRGFSVLIGASAAAILLGLSAPPARAQSTEASSVVSSSTHNWTVETKKGRRAGDDRYFIEFRGRAAANYGHMYVLYGKVNERDEIVASRIAGLHPAGDAENCFNCSLFNWTIGHVVFVPAETGASDGDLEEKYVTARYRVWMDKAHFDELDTYIRNLQAKNPMWNALWNNCVGFGRNIAEHMGLRIPAFIWLEPKDFVNDLRELNGLKAEQLPLKDAATEAVRKPSRKASHKASRSASRTPPLPPHRPKLGPASESLPTAAKTNPAPAKPKKHPVAKLPYGQAVASSATAN